MSFEAIGLPSSRSLFSQGGEHEHGKQEESDPCSGETGHDLGKKPQGQTEDNTSRKDELEEMAQTVSHDFLLELGKGISQNYFYDSTASGPSTAPSN